MLVDLVRLLAPFVPHLADAMWRNLVVAVDEGAPDSVHLADFPSVASGRRDAELEAAVDLARRVVALGRTARAASSVRTRQPLATLRVKLPGDRDGLSVDAASASGVRLDMVAAFTLVHFAAFGALGTVVAVAVHELELHAKHPLIVGLSIFALAEIGFFAAASLFLPGVIDRIGAVPIAVANLLAAAGIGLFLLSSHRPDVWSRVKHVIHVA